MHSLSPKTESRDKSKSDASPRQALTQLGQISFINTLPVVLPLSSGAVDANCQLVFGTPAELNKKLSRNELQLGAMSSFYFLEDGGFQLFPQVSISGTGRVGSVLLFSKDELNSLHGKIVDVPDSSATSIKLLQLLLKEEYGVEPQLRQQEEFVTSSPDARAVLLIGDKALKQDEQLQTSHLRVDLAQWWFKRFALPFVFGVWGARKNWAQDNRQEFEQIGESLVEAAKLGLTSLLPQVIEEAGNRTGLKNERLSCYYLNELDYRLTAEHDQALELFGKLCRKHGFISA